MLVRFAILPVTLACLLIAATPTASPVLRSIDPAHSTARFSVPHIWVERVTGTVPILSGAVTLAAGTTIPTSATAVLDATRIATGEPDRDRSLSSPDFFDAQKFPTWTFESTSVSPKGANTFEMDGSLTLHGVTQPERLSVTVGGTVAYPVYHATAQIDRHAFGMTVTRLDPTIGGAAEITLDIALK